MGPSSLAALLFLLSFLGSDVPWLAVAQPQATPTKTSSLNTLVWEQRINASLWLLQNKPCKFFTSSGNCTELRLRPRNAMNLYLTNVEKSQTRRKLVAVLPDKIKLVPTSYDAVLAIDPYPSASYGHPVLVFFVEYSSVPADCGKNRRSTLTQNGECVTIGQKSRRCTNRLHNRRRKRRCDINFIPSVFIKNAARKRQLLKCKPTFAGFADCPQKMSVHPYDERCENTKRCAITPKRVRRGCLKTCDYAVLLSGGWNAATATSKSKDNIKQMWGYLRRNGFKHENIVTFVGSRYAVELDGRALTKDSFPAANEFQIRSQIKNLCSSSCVDTLVIYLNKPTKSNGGILVWDENSDGFAEDSDRYEVKEFLEDLRNCKAGQVNVIADNSFSGILLEKFRSAKRHSSRGTLKNIVMVTSANSDSYSEEGRFTEYWTRYSLSRAHWQRCLKDVIQDLASLSTNHFQIGFDSSSQGLLDRTIYGGLCKKNVRLSTKDMGCRFKSRANIRKSLNRG